jgi:hypothetical protein
MDMKSFSGVYILHFMQRIYLVEQLLLPHRMHARDLTGSRSASSIF